VYYKSGCGLIICSFTGFIEIYDAINVNHSVWDNGKLKIKSGGGSISTVCYSEALDIIAYAGVSGKVYVLDQTTKNSNGQIQAHKGEVIMLRFYDAQHQLISVSQTGEVGLWDAQKLTKIQLLRNGANMSQKIISACSFYESLGRVLMATTKIFNYDLAVDSVVKIKTD
jgi:WD40 repeat protein